MKIGEVVRVKWYEFGDGVFSFHTAIQEDGSRVVFRSRNDRWPSVRAGEKGVEYKLLLNSSDEEVEAWLQSHPDFPVKTIVEV